MTMAVLDRVRLRYLITVDHTALPTLRLSVQLPGFIAIFVIKILPLIVVSWFGRYLAQRSAQQTKLRT